MESPLLTLLVLSLGVVSSFALSVESQGNANPAKQLVPSPPQPSVQDPHRSSTPPSHPSHPPPSPLSPPTPSLSPPPSSLSPPPSPPSLPPPPLSPPPRPLPPSMRSSGSNPQNRTRSPPHFLKRHNNSSTSELKRHNNSSTSEQKLNIGKKIGLMFVGVAAILQVCVVAFLGIKRRQLLKAND